MLPSSHPAVMSAAPGAVFVSGGYIYATLLLTANSRVSYLAHNPDCPIRIQGPYS